MTTCPVCRDAELVEGLTSIFFERDEIRITIQQVPALVCPSCGEAYLAEDVTSHLLVIADQVSEEGIREEVRVFS
jgi:YgiT-type zinc finger domain-containing protein